MLLLPAVASGQPQLNTIYNCGALTFLKAIPDKYINCIGTSPPYFGLRSYLPEGDPNKGLEIGLEETPAAYVAKLVELFREARRVLRDDGVMWLNLGDTYAHNRDEQVAQTIDVNTKRASGEFNSLGMSARTWGITPKNLLGIPWRVAFALQDDGWILRSEIIWHKLNPMPESVTDRPTKAHETVFLFAKSQKYFYDADAIREPHSRNWWTESVGAEYMTPKDGRNDGGKRKGIGIPTGANKRSVWTIATQPTPFAHFATFPTKLIEPMILAGCPDKTCAKCGAPWVRVESISYVQDKQSGYNREVKTTDYQPTCDCNADTRPGVVFDPFMGSGTTALVARKHGRDYIGSELNPEYAAIARERLRLPFDEREYTPPDKPLPITVVTIGDEKHEQLTIFEAQT